jgi:hypothetical protein
VDPLGEVLMKLLPEGLRALLAPAVTPPELMLAENPVPALLIPVMEPRCARAGAVVSASAVARAIIASLMIVSLCSGLVNKRRRNDMFRWWGLNNNLEI